MSDIARAFVFGAILGLLVVTVVLSVRLGAVGERTTVLEERTATAEANAGKLAERLVILTDAANDQRVVLDRLSAACVAAGDCVASDETGDNDG